MPLPLAAWFVLRIEFKHDRDGFDNYVLLNHAPIHQFSMKRAPIHFDEAIVDTFEVSSCSAHVKTEPFKHQTLICLLLFPKHELANEGFLLD